MPLYQSALFWGWGPQNNSTMGRGQSTTAYSCTVLCGPRLGPNPTFVNRNLWPAVAGVGAPGDCGHRFRSQRSVRGPLPTVLHRTALKYALRYAIRAQTHHCEAVCAAPMYGRAREHIRASIWAAPIIAPKPIARQRSARQRRGALLKAIWPRSQRKAARKPHISRPKGTTIFSATNFPHKSRTLHPLVARVFSSHIWWYFPARS